MQGKLRNMASVYITDGDRMLLLYRVGSRVVAPSWCGVGGHFEKDELNDAKAAILREVWEEIGLRECDLSNLKLRYITLRNKNGEIRQNYYFFAELAERAKIEKECNEGILEWVPVSEVCEREMPYTAGYVVRHYLETGRKTEAIYSGTATARGVIFAELELF